VNEGIIKGYLAYHEGRVVGWCNANTKAACLNCVGWYRFMPQVNEMEINPDEKVKSVYCFVVAPDMRRKGIARRLLQRVYQDALLDGFDYIEGYPEKDSADELKQFMGFVDLYKEFGFTVHGETDRKYVMRKQLKGAISV
jgi:GNAT superfamily N-acetyltransferase